jgi:GDPmannose 4,6-dehydratase
MPRALVTGVTGQDGQYLATQLLRRGYEVVGIARHPPVDEAKSVVRFRSVDITDRAVLDALFAEFDFDEVYHLAGPSYGPDSWRDPRATVEVIGTAVVRLLEIVREARKSRFFFASTSELFGMAASSPQSELTAFRPITPHGIAKQLAHQMVVAFRDRYGIFASCGILFNHESPLRRPDFVTRKITREVARIHAGLSRRLELGSLEAKRDWSFAGDFTDGMWRMLQADAPDDFVLASGESHTVADWCDAAFARVGLVAQDFVTESPDLVRGRDFDRVGDPSKAARLLGWRTTTSFADLVGMMVDADVSELEDRSHADATNLPGV